MKNFIESTKLFWATTTAVALIVTLVYPSAPAGAVKLVENGKGPIPKIESAETPERPSHVLPKLKTEKLLLSDTTATTESTGTSSAASIAESLGPNVIQNSSFEASNTSTPNWFKGGYGDNVRSFNFPVAGYNSSNAVRVNIAGYTSGAARWYNGDVAVSAGATYEFSDFYRSDTNSDVQMRFKKNDGGYIYKPIIYLSPSSTYKQAKARFEVPSGVVSASVFHSIRSFGSLITDAYSLRKVTTATANNLVPNGNLESAGSDGNPASWSRYRGGTNQASFIYPVSGVGGSRAAKVQITSYNSGEAKWYWSPQSTSAGIYEYKDNYQSNTTSFLEAKYVQADGAVKYETLGTVAPASSFSAVSVKLSVPQNTKAVAVSHLIKGVGYLTIDNVSLTFVESFSGIFTTGAVTLNFDDGRISQYQNALPKLQSAGLPGTFYIVTRQLADYGFSGYISKSQVKELYNKGQEIGAHTRTHANLTELSATERQAEIDGSRQDLLNMNVGGIDSFAYPYGAYNANVISEVTSAGFTGARSTNDGFVTQTTDRYQLRRQSVTNQTTVDQVKQWINEATANKTWLILVFHDIDTTGSLYSTTPSNFRAIVDYLVAQNIRVVGMDTGLNDMK